MTSKICYIIEEYLDDVEVSYRKIEAFSCVNYFYSRYDNGIEYDLRLIVDNSLQIVCLKIYNDSLKVPDEEDCLPVIEYCRQINASFEFGGLTVNADGVCFRCEVPITEDDFTYKTLRLMEVNGLSTLSVHYSALAALCEGQMVMPNLELDVPLFGLSDSDMLYKETIKTISAYLADNYSGYSFENDAFCSELSVNGEKHLLKIEIPNHSLITVKLFSHQEIKELHDDDFTNLLNFATARNNLGIFCSDAAGSIYIKTNISIIDVAVSSEMIEKTISLMVDSLSECIELLQSS